MLERPFYLIVVLWGERFRNYFLDLCVPTLLSAGNLPLLKTKQRSKFLICTRPEDWTALRAAPVFELLSQYVEPVYVEIPPCPAGTPGGVHMGTGHHRGSELAYAAKAYPLVLTPDCIFSDGTIARLQELALQGVQLALMPALRFAEEPLFDELERAGIPPYGRNGLAAPITLANRDIVRMALASLHSETKSFEWDAPYFHPIPSAVWWRVPDEDGIVVHSLSWAPLLIDYTVVPQHDTSTFENWTWDGDYIYNNLGNMKRVHLVLDSDEMFMASWSRLNENPRELTPQKELMRPFLGGFAKRRQFNNAFYGGFVDPAKNPLLHDPLKQQIFFRAARWHAKQLNDAWKHVERRALKTLYSCVAPPNDARILSLVDAEPIVRTDRLLAKTTACGDAVLGAGARVAQLGRHVWVHREALLPRLRQVMAGDRDVIRWLRWRARELAYHLIGRVAPGKPPRPSR